MASHHKHHRTEDEEMDAMGRGTPPDAMRKQEHQRTEDEEQEDAAMKIQKHHRAKQRKDGKKKHQKHRDDSPPLEAEAVPQVRLAPPAKDAALPQAPAQRFSMIQMKDAKSAVRRSKLQMALEEEVRGA